MKLTKDKLRALGIYNCHNLASTQPEPKVFVDYIPSVPTGLLSAYAEWRVYRIGFRIGAGGHEAFTCGAPREDKEPQRLAAVAWATERYGIAEWERSPFGSYHPKGTLAHVTRKVTS